MIFKIISKVNIQYIYKLLFAFISDFREDIIVYFYLINLFKDIFIIPLYTYEFLHKSCQIQSYNQFRIYIDSNNL